MKLFFSLLILLFLSIFGLKAQDCPYIEQREDSLVAIPSESVIWQWYRDGLPIDGANQWYYLPPPEEEGVYSVEILDYSEGFNFSKESFLLEGTLLDPLLKPIKGATCSCQDKSATTDEGGRFSIEGLMKEPLTVVLCQYPGKRNSIYAYKTSATTKQYVKMMMYPIEVTQIIDAEKGGWVHHQRGMLYIPPNGLVDGNGDVYTGEVQVYFRYLSPEDPLFGLKQEGGDGIALHENEEKILFSYGLIDVRLTAPGGGLLRMAENAVAKIYYHIPPSLQTSAPDQIPLWYFDVTNMYWQQEGWCFRQNNTYWAEIQDFSVLACATAHEKTLIEGKVMTCQINASKGVPIRVGQQHVFSDENSRFQSWIPAKKEISICGIRDTIQGIFTEDTLMVAFPIEAAPMLVNATLKGDMLTVYAEGKGMPYQYAIQAEGNYQWSNTFVLSDVEMPCVWIRDTKNCVYTFCFQPKPVDCGNSIGDQYFAFTPDELIGMYEDGNYVREGWLNEQDLESLPLDFFVLAPCLEKLQLNKNQLSQVPDEIGSLSELELLNLQGNELITLPSGIGGLRNVRQLWLNDNYLTTLPPEFGQLNQVRQLWLNNNELISLPAEFGQLSQLSELILNDNQLIVLPIEFGNLSNLDSLWASNNQLKSVPVQFGNLKQLQKVNLYNNKILSLPPEFGQLKNLKELSLGINQLSYLPAEFGDLSQLKSLNLTFNQLFEIPESFGNLTKLKWCSLSYNQLTSLPSTIQNLKNSLEELYLGGNFFSDAEKEKIINWLPNTVIYW